MYLIFSILLTIVKFYLIWIILTKFTYYVCLLQCLWTNFKLTNIKTLVVIIQKTSNLRICSFLQIHKKIHTFQGLFRIL